MAMQCSVWSHPAGFCIPGPATPLEVWRLLAYDPLNRDPLGVDVFSGVVRGSRIGLWMSWAYASDFSYEAWNVIASIRVHP
ncbi:MAG: hypothetical protein CMJ18_14865 [Phycisphaeraceae bacterium]|nr:hypothetical protein [Phycisphaeraceae bacterium]